MDYALNVRIQLQAYKYKTGDTLLTQNIAHADQTLYLCGQNIEKNLVKVKDGTQTLAACSKVSLKDNAYRDTQEGQSPECVHLLYKDSSCVGSDIGNYRHLEREYLPTLCLCNASANSCVDKLNTEGGKDPASWLILTAYKRRERAMPTDSDEQKQEVEKAEERDRSRRSAQTANGRIENLST